MVKSEHQLTRLILTPPIPQPGDIEERYTEPSNIWAVKAGRDVLPHSERRMLDDDMAIVNIYE